MTSSPCNSEPEIIEQVIDEFFAKSLHIILESRSPYVSSRNRSRDPSISSPSSSSPSSSARPRDEWFNLALKDRPAALVNFDLWRQSNLEPMVVDVLLSPRPSLPDAARAYSDGCIAWNLSSKDQTGTSEQDCFVPETKSEKIVERWVVQYESRQSSSSARESYSGSNKSSGITSRSFEIPAFYKETYKKLIMLLRSLYVTVRLLPAYNVFRALNSSGHIHQFCLSHKISSFSEPFTRAEDAEMNQFGFEPVDTPCGRLSLSVSYIQSLEDMSSEPSTSISTHFITDYVGNPTTHPLKRFQSLPSDMRHNWSNDRGETPAVSPSPSTHLPPPLLKQALPPCPTSTVTKPGCSSHAYKLRAQLTTTSAPRTSSPESRPPPIKKKSSRLRDFQIGMVLQKVLSFGKHGDGILPGLCSSTPIPFSRSSNRLSSLDQFDDDSDFTCLFAVDVEDSTNSCNRAESSDGKGHERGNSESGGCQVVKRSADATVGALIRMLKTALPLRQDLTVRNSRASEAEISNEKNQHDKGMEVVVQKPDNDAPSRGATAPGLFKSRTASDALEELRSYKATKELLLERVRSHSAAKSADGCSSEL